MRPERRADNSAVLAVPNVKVRMEAQHSVSDLSLHDVLRESFTLLLIFPPSSSHIDSFFCLKINFTHRTFNRFLINMRA